jgi:hypothetical protein
MTAVWFWARAELRARWRLWVVLGLLAGAVGGLAVAGVAGARRTDDVFNGYFNSELNSAFDAAVLPNDPQFDQQQRDEVAALPDVKATYPFVVPFFLRSPEGVPISLIPTTAESQEVLTGPLIEGRAPDPNRPDEVVIDENTRADFDVDIGGTYTIAQQVPPEAAAQLPPGVIPEGDVDFEQQMSIVGITKSVSDDYESTTSAAFYEKYADAIAGPVNLFVDLDGGEDQVDSFQQEVTEITGKPTNVERGSDLLGKRQVNTISGLEQGGLLLFSLAVIIGGGVLVGQALVRAVSAGAAELEAWRAIGAGRRMTVASLAAPAALTAVVGAAVTVPIAVALSSVFPIGELRNYDLDPGIHADWPAIVVGALALLLGILATAWLTAEWRAAHREQDVAKTSTTGDLVARAGLPPAFVVGSRLAIEPGRGRRAVPVRSALVGAIVGVLGVVACFTFRAGITDAVDSPQRSGVVWDYGVVNYAGLVPPRDIEKVVSKEYVGAATDAVWARAVDINGVSTPTFGTEQRKGDLDLVVVEGRAPTAHDEIAMAPTTMNRLDVGIGDEVTLGTDGERTATVVGRALLPATSHTDYDQSAWVTLDTLNEVLPPKSERAAEDTWDYVLIRWAPDAPVAKAERQLHRLKGGTVVVGEAELPPSVTALDDLRTLPLVLGIFFGLLACATVAHALVTTVRRRRPDLAVLRTIGFTPGQSRLAIAFQATLLAVAGLVVGIPLGILTGRTLWRWLTDTYPLVYVPPLSVVALLLALPAALLLANALAAGPARSAARTRPAEILRTE